MENVHPSLIRSKENELTLGNAEILRSPYLMKKLRDYEIFYSPCYYCMALRRPDYFAGEAKLRADC